MTTREWESTLNIALAAALRGLGMDARPEVMHPNRRRIDVEVHIGSATIAVEAEHGQTPAKQTDAIKDADARLKQGLATCAVAVCYPADTTRETLPAAKFIWTVRDGSPQAAQWTGGDLERLVSVLRLAPAQLGNPDNVAASLSSSLDGAVQRLSAAQKELLAQALDLPRQTRNGRPVRNPWDAPAKRALLVVATAVMFHSRLDVHLRDMRPERDNRHNPPPPYGGPWPPAMAQQCADSDTNIAAFRQAWDLILALDYKPIFQTGRAALGACPPDSAVSAAISEVAAAALKAAENIASLRHDLLGRIFHTVLDSARYDGSFYTTTPAATLLAALAITESMCDWQDPAAVARLRITDPACGTGTLLMAAAERIRDLNPRLRDDAVFSAALIEQVLAGYDVNLTATHMAATTLGLLSPSTQFQKMKIWRSLLGVDADGVAHLGSLEFLDQKPMLMPWPNGGSKATQVNGDAAAAMAEPSDLVIMNPPFTRSDLRHDQFTEEEELKLKSREKELFANKPVHLSSNGNAFMVLADFINKAETGVIAAILPLVTATNASALEIRQHLADRYHIETIVTSHDPGRIYFSENTSIGEMLLVCRRWPAGRGRKPPTQVVNLARNPDTPAEAFNAAAAIADGTVARQDYGTVQQWPVPLIAAGNWGAVQFLAPELCEKFLALRRGGFFPVTSLREIANVGPDGGGIRVSFDRSPLPGSPTMVALWDHKTDLPPAERRKPESERKPIVLTQSMSARPDTYILPKAGKVTQAQNLWARRGRLLLPSRVFLQTARVVAVRLNMPGLGSAWVPCHINDSLGETALWEKALCAYFNSTIGILAMLGDRSNRKPTYPNISINDMRNFPIPDFAAIGGPAVSQLAAAYDQYADAVLRPLPQMNNCPVRQGLDAAVVAALGLDAEEMDSIRRQLAMEPSVTGRRYAGFER